MRTKHDRRPTADELLSGYYGRSRTRPSLEDVVGSYYAGGFIDVIEVTGRSVASSTTATSMSAETMPADDGEILANRGERPGTLEEYVLPDLPELPAAPAVASPAVASPTAPAAPAAPVPSTDAVPPTTGLAEELKPLGPPPATTAPERAEQAPPGAGPTTSAVAQLPRNGSAAPTNERSPSGGGAAVEMSQDDLAADLAAILNGEKVFDPATKRTVTADQVGRPAPAEQAPPELPAPGANEQAIFDRIAQSMAYANAYDLGTVELANRFADFDRAEDQRDQRRRAPNTTSPSEPSEAPLAATDVVADLERIRRQADSVAAAGGVRLPTADGDIVVDGAVGPHTHEGANDDVYPACRRPVVDVSADDPLSRPLYDTGEHAQIGGDQYAELLRVGQNPGIRMSYGQIVAMPDFYRRPEDLLDADLAEITELKRLTVRSTSYYVGRKSDRTLEVSDAEWDRATRGRYLELAEDNYEHFAPDDLGLAVRPPEHGNHRDTWEGLHRKALETARREILAGQAQQRSVLPEEALVISAFADHFLTDAFAAGHLLNKDALIQLFLSRFFNGSSLTAEGDAFFDRVASAAFVGRVAQRFSELETVDTPVCAWGWCLAWHPNIDSVSRFKSLLTTAATTEPTKIANLAVKALHDHLNETGVQAVNAAGDGPWPVMGDGHLNERSLTIMRRAVLQSIANVNDPTILSGTIDFPAMFARVWHYVPRPVDAERSRLASLAREYTSPTSTTLSTAAARVISSQLDYMIAELVRRGKLRPA